LPGTASARRSSWSSLSVGRSGVIPPVTLMARAGERAISSASIAALKTALRTPTLVRTVAGASRATMASTHALMCAGVIFVRDRSPNVGMKWVSRTTLSRATVVARLAGLALIHSLAHSANVVRPRLGSSHTPRSISVWTRARYADPSALVAKVLGAGISRPSPSG
jgi:hypothetical protein